MRITEVCKEDVRRYVPVKGWESVKIAITAFADGKIRGSHDTTSVTVLDLARSGRDGCAGAGLFLLAGALAGREDSFTTRLLDAAKAGIDRNGRFSKSYDYDGAGSFFKTSVEIFVLDRKEDMYGIGLWAAYVGDKPEEGLAQYLSCPRTLINCVVEATVQPAGLNAFEFDFETIIRKLDSVLGTKKLRGKTIVGEIMACDPDRGPSFLLKEDDGMVVRIAPRKVEDRMRYERGRKGPRDTWAMKGSVLMGELKRDYVSSNPDVKAAPSFAVTVSPVKNADRIDQSGGIWQPEEQQKVIDLATSIADALR